MKTPLAAIIALLLLSLPSLAAPDTVASVRARAHKEIADRDATIEQMRQQLDAQTATIQALTSQAADKYALIAQLQKAVPVQKAAPVGSPAPKLTGAATLLPSAPETSSTEAAASEAALPSTAAPILTRFGWLTINADGTHSYTATDKMIADQKAEKANFAPVRNPLFPPDPTGKRIVLEYTFLGGRKPDLLPDMVFYTAADPGRVARRPMPEGSTAEDFAIGLADICRELGKPVNRVGTSVYILDVVVGEAPCTGFSCKIYNP